MSPAELHKSERPLCCQSYSNTSTVCLGIAQAVSKQVDKFELTMVPVMITMMMMMMMMMVVVVVVMMMMMMVMMVMTMMMMCS